MKQTKTLLSILWIAFLFSLTFAYSLEDKQAYNYAYQNWITTMPTIERANMWWNLKRIEMAKMLSNYAINILGLAPDTTKNCNFSDVSSNLDYQYDNGVTKACQLGLMWVGINQFYPNWKVTRAEFGTVLSRALNAKDISKLNQMNDANPYYSEHLNYLNEQWIMNNISNPGSFELRWRVMLMLMRSDKNYTWSEIASFDELDDIVATCHVDDMWWYDYKIYKNSFIVPYKDWYIGYELAWQDGIPFFLTYRKLNNPCELISRTDEIFTWNPNYEVWFATMCWNSYPDNKIYVAQWVYAWVPMEEIVKELNCVAGKNADGMGDKTCTTEAKQYFYNLVVWNETNSYFSKWMNKFKKDIDNGIFTPKLWTDSYNYDICLQKVRKEIWEVQATDSLEVRCNYIKQQTEKMHECAMEYLNN